MRLRLIFALWAVSALAQATSTLRVGSQVLTAGDSALRVTELLGKPTHKSRRKAARSGRHRGKRSLVVAAPARGEQWEYQRGDHVTTVTLVDGRVSEIEDRRR